MQEFAKKIAHGKTSRKNIVKLPYSAQKLQLRASSLILFLF